MKHHLFVPTVGEPSTQDALAAIKKHFSLPYNITVWHDTRGNQSFYSYDCDDVITLSKNHGITPAIGWAVLYLDAEFIWIIPADNLVLPHTQATVEKYFEEDPKLFIVGSSSRSGGDPFHKNDPHHLPDNCLVIRRSLVPQVGSLCPSFKGHGHEVIEWQMRALKAGLNIVHVQGLYKEFGDGHRGRDGRPDLEEAIRMNERVVFRVSEDRPYNWMQNDL